MCRTVKANYDDHDYVINITYVIIHIIVFHMCVHRHVCMFSCVSELACSASFGGTAPRDLFYYEM